ncbi:SsrA-binding protein [Verrucomicrobium sp. GAS474]|uniref:SsrA-binding protein SmpB n=1 Tax=Verrucomicrobium sp. GAS474 TaxID=1882831 RepID=UPI00087A0003|nr:SsrA-binding protein SmpB [Verrucomicrobium sp. GAS474]SDU15334.1 SsrA-binding protein [Verrucomicrobium sp. GAS474]
MGDDVITNRKAHHHYRVLDTYEAGMVLHGTEVKSIRLGHGNLDAAFARIEKGEAFLYQFDIQPYAKASVTNHEAKAVRKLLLHKTELRKLNEATTIKGHSLVPLKLYWKNGKLKLLLGVGTGKDARDKRQDIKKAESKREVDRAMKQYRK